MTVCDWSRVATVSEVIKNDLHVITVMKQHTLRLKCFPVRKVNWNSKSKGMRGENKHTNKKNKKQTKTTIGQLDGTLQVLKWNFNRCLIQNEDLQQINNWKSTLGAQQIPDLHKQSQDLSRIHKPGISFSFHPWQIYTIRSWSRSGTNRAFETKSKTLYYDLFFILYKAV